VCFASIPLSALRVGYRSLTLFEENEDNNYRIEALPLSRLFLRIGLLSNDAFAISGAAPNKTLSRTSSPDHSSPPSSATSPGRSRDSNSRMVGMDLSPGNKHWRRLSSRGGGSENGGGVGEQELIGAGTAYGTPETSTRSRYSPRHLRRSATTGDSPSQSSTSATARSLHSSGGGQRERISTRRSSSRQQESRAKPLSSRSQSVDR
jgi:hypothetical protein